MEPIFVVSTDPNKKFWFLQIPGGQFVPHQVSEVVGLVYGQDVKNAGLWKRGNVEDVQSGLKIKGKIPMPIDWEDFDEETAP